MQLGAMLVAFMVGPIATPALIWFTLAADLPLALVILLLVTMAVVSNGLSHIIIRRYNVAEAGGPHTTGGDVQEYCRGIRSPRRRPTG